MNAIKLGIAQQYKKKMDMPPHKYTRIGYSTAMYCSRVYVSNVTMLGTVQQSNEAGYTSTI